CYNNTIFDPLKRYLQGQGIPISQWIQTLFEQRALLGEGPASTFKSFREETRSELWESEEKLVAHYSKPDHYQKLLNYQEGGNVLFKHRVWMLSKHPQEWVADVFRLTASWLKGMPASSAMRNDELKALETFITLSVTDCLTPEGVGR